MCANHSTIISLFTLDKASFDLGEVTNLPSSFFETKIPGVIWSELHVSRYSHLKISHAMQNKTPHHPI